MELEDPVSFDVLFKNDFSANNPEKFFPLIRRCIEVSKNETEILQAVKIAFETSFNLFSLDELEEELFHYVCPAAKNIFISKLKYLENSNSVLNNNSVSHSQFLSTCVDILCDFLKIFERFSDIQKVTVSSIGSLLVNSAEIIHSCFFHCKESEKLYESSFTSLAGILGNLFKKCCDLLEELLLVVTEKLESELDDGKDVDILCELLSYLSKSGIVLLNLEVKTMAKVWKTFLFLLEKYFNYLREEFDIGETINCLCCSIISSVENILCDVSDIQEVNKLIKLDCFILKLVIKFCEKFLGYLRGCQESLLNLLLTLCKCNSGLLDTEKHEIILKEGFINQLIIGTDPVLMQLITDEKFTENFQLFCQNLPESKEKSATFLVLCCSVLRKLMLASSDIRSLWLKDDGNILEWLFIAVSYSQYDFCVCGEFPGVLVPGKLKRPTDLYEHVLVTVSAFIMTATSTEFSIVENILVKNVLQTNPWCALLASDIWCLLIRFADSSLGFAQVFNLSKILLEFNSDTVRVEKCFLTSLIRRLFSLLTKSQKDVFLKSFDASFYSQLWGDHEISNIVKDFSSQIAKGITDLVIKPMELVINQEDPLAICQFNVENSMIGNHMSYESLEKKVAKLWKFNHNIISSCHSKVKFFRIACAMANYVVPHMSSETLLLILSQVKKLLSTDQPSCIKLYFACILKSLSSFVIPADNFQITIFGNISDIFRELLSCKEPFVKQKALEVFYTFSHRTRHVEIITSTVQNSSVLKVEITNYFQKKLPDERCLNLNEYIRKLCEVKYQHKCQSREQFVFRSNEFERCLKKPKVDVSSLDEIVERWKQESKKVMESVNSLSNLQKDEVKEICESITKLLL